MMPYFENMHNPKHGAVDCPECGARIGATATGKVWKHGYVRHTKKGTIRTMYPNLQGEDHYCKGSWKQGEDWDKDV